MSKHYWGRIERKKEKEEKDPTWLGLWVRNRS
jgi:hypothetical protein